jgi:hypothetical protein
VQAGGAGRHDRQVGAGEAERIDMWPEIMLMIDAGTKNGEMRRAPRSRYSSACASIIGSPPMPEPTMQPMRSACSSVSASPWAARRRHRLDRRRHAVVDEGVHVARFLGRHVVLDIEALDLAGDAAGKRRGIEARDRPMPLRPATRLAQPSATLLPTGLISPVR